jgi:hypothetical protein
MMAQSSRSHGCHGHIQPYERDANNAIPIIKEDIEATEEHKESVRTILNNDIVDVTRQEYRNYINEMCTFFYQKYHEYCVAGGI